jgi:hypothetical protein
MNILATKMKIAQGNTNKEAYTQAFYDIMKLADDFNLMNHIRRTESTKQNLTQIEPFNM